MGSNNFHSIVIGPWKPYEVFVNFDGKEFPPPPPTFVLPLSNDTCTDPAKMPDCINSSVENVYDCNCDMGSTYSMCLCIFATVLPINGNMIPEIDIDNKGFCLEYNQL